MLRIYKEFTEDMVREYLRNGDMPVLCENEESRVLFRKIMKDKYHVETSDTKIKEGGICLYSDGCWSSIYYAMREYGEDKIFVFKHFKDNSYTLLKLRGENYGKEEKEKKEEV